MNKWPSRNPSNALTNGEMKMSVLHRMYAAYDGKSCSRFDIDPVNQFCWTIVSSPRPNPSFMIGVLLKEMKLFGEPEGYNLELGSHIAHGVPCVERQ